MALMVPNTEAMAVRHENSASKMMIAINRFDILISRKDPAVRSLVVLATTIKPAPLLAEKSARKLSTAGTMDRSFGTAFWQRARTKRLSATQLFVLCFGLCLR